MKKAKEWLKGIGNKLEISRSYNSGGVQQKNSKHGNDNISNKIPVKTTKVKQ